MPPKTRKRKLIEHDESPPKKRPALERTSTIELEAPIGSESDWQARILRKTSTFLASVGVEGSLSIEHQNELTKKLSSILQPTPSKQTIDLNEFEPSLYAKRTPDGAQSLPEDIWIQIFYYLEDSDRLALALTSSHWMRIFKDFVGFDRTPLYHVKDLQLLFHGCDSGGPEGDDFTTSDCYITTVERKWLGSDHIAHFGKHCGGVALSNRLGRLRILVIKKEKTNYCVIPIAEESVNSFPKELISHGSSKHWFPFVKTKSKRRFDMHVPEFIEGALGTEENLTVEWKIYPTTKRAEFLLYMDNKAIRKAAINGTLTKFEKMAVLLQIKMAATESFQNWDWMHSTRSIHNPRLPSAQPKGFKDISLHEYQLRALSWMKTIETSSFTKEYQFSPLYQIPGSTKLYLNVSEEMKDINNGYFTWQCFLDDEPKLRQSFSLRGGILADEMGLGKTISMIALLLSNPRIKTKNSFEVNHNGKVHSETKATLVVCAPHLVAQWTKEIQSKTSLKVKKISTLTNIKSTTHKDILEHDVVIVPYSLVTTNKKYSENYKLPLPSEVSQDSKFPILHHYGWHRIIADEAHEIDWKTIRIWDHYHSNYRWYVTGTPFPQGRESFIRALLFLGVSFSHKVEHFGEPPNSYAQDMHPSEFENRIAYDVLLMQAFMKCGFWRNTKFDVAEQTDIPPLTENVIYLELTPVEKALYDAAALEKNPDKIQREICSDPFSAPIFPFRAGMYKMHEIPVELVNSHTLKLNLASTSLLNSKDSVEHWKTRIEEISEELKEIKGKKKRYLKEIKNKEAELDNAEKTLRNCKRTVENYSKEIIKQTCLVSLYSRLLPRSNSDPCDLCEKPIVTPCTTSCNHIFCAACIAKHVHENHNCPICYVTQSTNDLTFELVPITNEEDAKREALQTYTNFDPLQEVINTHGSKMAAVTEYLLDVVLSQDIRKVIVFSQYEQLLSWLMHVLITVNEEAFRNQIVLCKGNIHVRTKKLAEFNSMDEKSPRILMLSLLNAASGTQLEAASHIVLLDPVVGTRDEAQAIDAQAIARAHRLGQENPVEAIRFIAAHTIEQRDYENAYGVRSRAKSARK